jgi:hypothetical protein
MFSKEELANMPLSYFEKNIEFPWDQGLINDIKLLAMDEVELVFVDPFEFPQINLK